jgi:hypothetical protein
MDYKSPELWVLVGIVVVQLANIYNNYQNAKTARQQAQQQHPLVEAQAEKEISEGWTFVAQEYQRQIENLRGLETENASLRPLVLKLALQEEDMKQCQKDKEDWKTYSQELIAQIKSWQKIPLPFIRHTGDDSQSRGVMDTQNKIKAIQAENK